jgi:peptidoglycan/LPS O-acetylase OafA/YrhL
MGAISSGREFRNDVQGLRAIAVLAVVLYHAGVPFLPGGYVGVDVFFVISGFLITSHLLSNLERDDRVQFASFYAKRIRRILPASFVVLALSVIAALVWYPPLLLREVWEGAISTALYIPNLLFAFNGTNYLAEETPSLFQHYWSLGIEEQFYLLWPLFLAVVWKLSRSRKTMLIAITGVVGVSFALGLVLTFQSQPWAFFSLPTRAWELGAGGLVAMMLMHGTRARGDVVPAIVGWAGVAGIFVSVFLFSSSTVFPGYWAIVPVASTAAVIYAGATPSRFGPTAVLSNRLMVFIGTISYSLYLIHWPALLLPQAAVGFQHPLPLWITICIAFACIPVAWAMYRLIENPARSLSWLASSRPRRSLLAAGGASIVIVLAVTGGYAALASRPLNVPREVATSSQSAAPVFSTFVPSNLQPSLNDASGDQADIYADECHLDFEAAEPADCVYGNPSGGRVVLFGDSHAAQWFPAVLASAEKANMSVQSHSKSSCPSVDGPILLDGVPYTACEEWRAAVLTQIRTSPPDLVILSNRGGSAGFDRGTQSRPKAWGDALSRTLEQLDVPVVVLADTPDLDFTPSVCLSANLTDVSECGAARDVALGRTMNGVEASVAAEHDVPVVDLTDDICSATRCDPIIGNTLVYRDGNHLTATFSKSLGGALSKALAEVRPQD